MKKFKNIKTGNIIHVKDEVAATYIASEQYEEVAAPAAKKSAKAEKPAE